MATAPRAPLHAALAIWIVRDHVRLGASMSLAATTTALHAIRAALHGAGLAGAMSAMATPATATTAAPGQPTLRAASVAAMMADMTTTTVLRGLAGAIPAHPIRAASEAASEACAAGAHPLAMRGGVTPAAHAPAPVEAPQLTPTDVCAAPLSLAGAVDCGARMRSSPVG